MEEKEYKQGEKVLYNGAIPELWGKEAEVIKVVKWEGWNPYYVIQFSNGRTTEVIEKYLVEA